MKYNIIQYMINPLLSPLKEEEQLLYSTNFLFIAKLYKFFYMFDWEPGPRGNFSVIIKKDDNVNKRPN